jgi:hypothetical protein
MYNTASICCRSTELVYWQNVSFSFKVFLNYKQRLKFRFSLFTLKCVIQKNFRPNRYAIFLGIIISCVFFLAKCVNSNDKKEYQSRGDNVQKICRIRILCQSATRIFITNIFTEHHLTSAPSTEKNILGSFEPGNNVFAFDPFTDVKMEKRDSGFYQVEYNNGNKIREGRFDSRIGSGRKGQSYLSWMNNRLVQLPITYFSPENNGPIVRVIRRIRCFLQTHYFKMPECHSTYFEKTSDPSKKLETFRP